jgi:hypothetical protein
MQEVGPGNTWDDLDQLCAKSPWTPPQPHYLEQLISQQSKDLNTRNLYHDEKICAVGEERPYLFEVWRRWNENVDNNTCTHSYIYIYNHISGHHETTTHNTYIVYLIPELLDVEKEQCA